MVKQGTVYMEAGQANSHEADNPAHMYSGDLDPGRKPLLNLLLDLSHKSISKTQSVM